MCQLRNQIAIFYDFYGLKTSVMTKPKLQFVVLLEQLLEPQLHSFYWQSQYINIYLLTKMLIKTLSKNSQQIFYVDDNFNGDDSDEKTFELYRNSVACLKDAGFELRKFHINDANLQTKINKIEKFQPLEDNLRQSIRNRLA